MTSAELCIPHRYCGPPKSGNGGYTSGSLADLLPGDATGDAASEAQSPTVEVTLLRPPPLEVPLAVTHEDGAVRLDAAEGTVARARSVDTELPPVEAVSPQRAAEASARFPGLVSHPFPTCFSCGPERAEGDGLRIFPGPVAEDRVAALWTPAADLAESSDLLDQGVQRVGPGVTWAALDCVGGWAGDMADRMMVLGRMTAQVDAYPVVGEPHVVIGAARGREGRKTFTASTLYDSDGRIVARAAHVWIAVDPAAFS